MRLGSEYRLYVSTISGVQMCSLPAVSQRSSFVRHDSRSQSCNATRALVVSTKMPGSWTSMSRTIGISPRYHNQDAATDISIDQIMPEKTLLPN